MKHQEMAKLAQLIAEVIQSKPIPIEIVNPGRPKKPHKIHAKQTPFMLEQVRIFKTFLDKHPVCASYSLITRARQCWNEHKTEWNTAAKNKTGYTCYKTLARTVQYRN